MTGTRARRRRRTKRRIITTTTTIIVVVVVTTRATRERRSRRRETRTRVHGKTKRNYRVFIVGFGARVVTTGPKTPESFRSKCRRNSTAFTD